MPKQRSTAPSWFRRHPFWSLTGLLSLLFAGGVCLFLATFDLNAYRQSLAERLSLALRQPVSIGSTALIWHKGPAFDLGDVRIGASRSAAVGEISHLFLKPRLLPMLSGKVVFDDMVLEKPHLQLQGFSFEQPGDGELFNLLSTLLQTVQVKNLTIVDGQLTLASRHADSRSAPVPAHIDAVQLKLRHLTSGRSCKIRIEARLMQQQGIAHFNGSGRLALDPDLRNWQTAQGQLQLQLENLALEEFARWIHLPPASLKLTGTAALTVRASGSLSEGMHFSAGVEGEKIALDWPKHYRQPRSMQKFAAEGIWILTDELAAIHDLKLSLDQLHLQGRLSLQRDKKQPWLEGTFASPPLALPRLRQWLPEEFRAPQRSLLPGNLEQGSLQIDHLRLAGPLHRFRQIDAPLPITHARLTLRKARLDLAAGLPLEEVNCSLTYQDGRLDVSQGTASLLTGPLVFSGRADRLFSDAATLTLTAGWTAPAAKLWQHLSAAHVWPGKAGGVIGLGVSVAGRPGKLQAEVRADLSGCSIELQHRIKKSGGQPGKLSFSAHQLADNWNIEKGLLTVAPFTLHFSGHLGTAKPLPLDFRLQLSPTDLKKVAELFPGAAAQHFTGTASLNGNLSGTLSAPAFNGRMVVSDVRLTLPGLRSELQNINGSFNLQNHQCRFRDVKARLGQSEVLLSGTLNGLAEAVLRLHVRAPRLRADELIFSGGQVEFRNLDGIMVLDRQHILYENIRFDLHNGRKFHLSGHQTFSPNHGELNIHARKASIDEVLALWDEPLSNGPAVSQNPSRLVIHASVDEGQYGNLRFSDAKGMIVAENNRVNISPLRCRLAAGSANGTILIDNSIASTTPLLTLTGNLSGVDAGQLQADLLRNPGLISGSMDGAFYLQGPAGPELLIRGKGGADIRMKNGVLYRFSFLSKVFSLFNVSQIFSFRLPDMAQKGMPFKRLDATLRLDEGHLETEDLIVESNAMNLSLVGNWDLRQDRLNLVMGVKPFGTVDKIVSSIPLAGWILTGESKALITAHFRISGPSGDPDVDAIPVTSVSEKVLGIFQRVLGLPGKVIEDVGELFQTGEP